MIKHIVLLQFAATTNEKQIKHIFELLTDLKKTIPQIKTFTYGKYESHEGENKGFEYGFETEFDNAKDRDHYLAHPDHIAVAHKIIPLLANGMKSLIAFDFDPTKKL
ncbi:Dabb family protein [Orbaceae bacterium ESL0727]|nr:Dabb family protein [Orbaceae bacterium ESL0727]